MKFIIEYILTSVLIYVLSFLLKNRLKIIKKDKINNSIILKLKWIILSENIHVLVYFYQFLKAN